MNKTEQAVKIALKVHDRDAVATVFAEGVTAGSTVTVRDPHGAETLLKVKDAIPYGHKVALKAIPKGARIIKYGEEIGAASRRIEKGAHVHVHNLDSLRGRGDLEDL